MTTSHVEAQQRDMLEKLASTNRKLVDELVAARAEVRSLKRENNLLTDQGLEKNQRVDRLNEENSRLAKKLLELTVVDEEERSL
jgi:ribonuclease HI